MSRSRHVGLGFFVLVLYAAYSLYIGKGSNQSNEKQQVTVNEVEIIKGEVNVATATVSYYHCGPTYGATGNNQGNVGGKDKEIILLHGAAFTKQNWVDSGILKDFCSAHLSVYALDLNTRGLTGDSFVRTLEAFQEQGLISGNPMTIVTPSASGKALVDMGAAAVIAAAVKNGKEIALTRFVRVWIPVASGSVLTASGKAIEAFRNVHVLAIHGAQDEMGRKVTKRLVELAGATPVEMYGTHPCYLDSPKDFVETILAFLSNTVG
uniref:AB hydrolase-1 domain-containing protein n=1 Tax=Attheya septentrionalis TaxID=420275 RepID=A0A7S2UKV6_9STRA|mmetsp:Transcript_27267/g.49530  ORF Transcript_27267/g.49530 Transcript_27267/m.49530 type:complete len:265 (+) Transcript_27267:227-1021(+)